MQNTIHSDLIRGNINTIILKALFEGDRYGFDIVKEIEQKSSGQYVLKQPTLYSCLKRLEVQSFIRSYWGAKTSGGRRKYYTLTDTGRELFIRNQEEWEYSRTVIDKLISDKEYDFSTFGDGADEGAEAVLSEEAFDGLEEVDGAEAADETDAESVQAEEPPQPADEAEAEAETEVPPVEFLDSAKILDGLFADKNGESYTGNLINDSYTAVPQKKPPSYEATDGGLWTDDRFEAREQESESGKAEELSLAFKPSPPTPSAIGGRGQAEGIDAEEAGDSVAKKPTETEFISYKTTLAREPSDDRVHLERDYRDILSKLVRPQALPADPVESGSSGGNADEGGAAKWQGGDDEPSTAQACNQPPVQNPAARGCTTPSTAEESRTPNPESRTLNPEHTTFDRVSQSFKELGANVSVRTHNANAAKEHTEKLYYYSHRLMLPQYFILFFVMLAMIGATYLTAFWLGIVGPLDLYVYIGAGILAAAFPLASAVLRLRDPDKKVRARYHFKSSLLYRTILLINALAIIYFINVIAKMNLSFSNALEPDGYLCSLMLPALLALCLPLDTLIFSALYGSGKYAVKQ